MAQTIHLFLEIDGNAIEGESTISSLDREGSIECAGVQTGVATPLGKKSGRLKGRRKHQPLTITKEIDKSTPLLLRALCLREPVTKAEFRFYRPDTSGSGAEEQFYTILLENGYVASVEQWSENEVLGGPDASPAFEEVSFVFQDITWTYESNGATHKDSWQGES